MAGPHSRGAFVFNLKHREKLLIDIVSGLKKIEVLARVINVRVRLYCADASEPVKEFLGLHEALDVVVHDCYWDENSNWSDADRAEVDTY
jgi:hypothetical protein